MMEQVVYNYGSDLISYLLHTCFLIFAVPLMFFSPWHETSYKDAAERTTQENLTLKGFLAGVCISTSLS